MNERKEAWMRIVVGIISGIILELWGNLVQILAIVHWFVVMFKKKRNKNIARFCEIWNTQFYVFVRYMTFVTNYRPFPFNKIEKSISKFEK